MSQGLFHSPLIPDLIPKYVHNKHEFAGISVKTEAVYVFLVVFFGCMNLQRRCSSLLLFWIESLDKAHNPAAFITASWLPS